MFLMTYQSTIAYRCIYVSIKPLKRVHKSYPVLEAAPPFGTVPDCFQLCLLGDLDFDLDDDLRDNDRIKQFILSNTY